MKSDTDGDLGLAVRCGALRDENLHFARRLRRRIGVRKCAHRAVADGFDHPAAELARGSRKYLQAILDLAERRRIAHFFVQARAVADVSEQHCKHGFLTCHGASILSAYNSALKTV